MDQAKDLYVGAKVRSTNGAMWTVATLSRKDSMVYATGTSSAGVQYAIAKKQGWPVTIIK